MAIPPELDAALQDFAAQQTLLVCVDFDGCVAELVADAAAARPVPVNAEALERLAQVDGVRLAYVSGRPLQTLQELASPPAPALLFGSHGAERWLGPDSAGLELDDEQAAERREVLSTLETVAAEHEGAWVEHKPAGGAIHVRRMDDPTLGEAVLDQARSALALVDGAHIKEGKQVLEALVVQSSKGEAIEELRELTSADAVFFAGDDVTDEQGFAVLREGDVGLKVGPGETRADFRVPEPANLAEVLHRIAQLRDRAS
ncbi:trehalose-phosphatase [Nesterenkonia sphaerica]|uniref:Trehalose 6-phosphate phosphatase n=1 Tax=Nesterenkonia sphaerica TaxID=1804988 RepID=A0A5R9A7Q7_9MICC|nr:trehalose-phosphatase [Nesterenkonia sphaerica]TLP74045.1 trehalose-phosphatase [Nesterenkonia sphaerica]